MQKNLWWIVSTDSRSRVSRPPVVVVGVNTMSGPMGMEDTGGWTNGDGSAFCLLVCSADDGGKNVKYSADLNV